MSDGDNKLEISLPGEWLVKKLLGPTVDEVGEDFSKLYKAGRNKILNATNRKVEDIDDGFKANLRVARDVFWNGSFTESDICAEYYSGALASSRSRDGADDSAIFFLNKIQSLSSSQLHLHYIIYNSLNKILADEKKELNIGDSDELSKIKLHLSSVEIIQNLKIPLDLDTVALYKSGLVDQYKMNTHKLEDGRQLPFTMVVPTTLGIQLYAMSLNMLSEYRDFAKKNLGEFPEIKTVNHYSLDINKLV